MILLNSFDCSVACPLSVDVVKVGLIGKFIPYFTQYMHFDRDLQCRVGTETAWQEFDMSLCTWCQTWQWDIIGGVELSPLHLAHFDGPYLHHRVSVATTIFYL